MFLNRVYGTSQIIMFFKRLNRKCRIKYPRAVESLIEALNSKGGDIRKAAVEDLGLIGDSSAVEPLVQVALRDRCDKVRESAIIALVQLSYPRTAEFLIPALTDANENVRCRAADAMLWLADPRVVEPLMRTLQDEDRYIRWREVVALRELNDPRATEDMEIHETVDKAHTKIGIPVTLVVVPLLKDTRPEVRKAAIDVLQRTKWVPENNNEKACYLIARGEIDELLALGRSTVDPLVAALNEDAPHIRIAAIQALSEIGNTLSIDLLSPALKSRNGNVREQAVKALGKIEKTEVVELLIGASSDEDSNIRKTVAVTLGQIANPLAIKTLCRLIIDTDPQVQQAAAEALGRIGIPALTDLISFLDHTNSSVRKTIICKLGEIGDATAIGPLLKTLTDQDHNTRKISVESLEMIGGPVVDYLAARMNYNNKAACRKAIEALWEIEEVSLQPHTNKSPCSERVKELLNVLKRDSEFLYRYNDLSYSINKLRQLPEGNQKRLVYFALTEGDKDVQNIAHRLMRLLRPEPENFKELKLQMCPKAVQCTKCGATILPVTAKKHCGRCKNCYRINEMQSETYID